MDFLMTCTDQNKTISKKTEKHIDSKTTKKEQFVT
jgi:hypothetical protein